jgi:hypothetical protein
MIDILFEQRVIQNTGLAAEAIWYAVNEAYLAQGKAGGVPFPLVFLILPLTFHQRSAQALAKKTQSGAIFKALAEDREITVGLQARMQSLSNRTLQGLSIALHTGLVRLDQDGQRQILPKRKSPPVNHVTDEVKVIFQAAKRVGFAFSEMTPVQLSGHLNIRF